MVKDKIKVGKLELKNRIVKAPIQSNTCILGKVTQNTISHYNDRTKGGRFGLVIVEHSFVRYDGMAGPSQMSASHDSDIEGLKRLLDLIHQNGSTAILQLSHAGCGAQRCCTGATPISASNLSIMCGLPNGQVNPETPKPMTKDDILAIEECFFYAAGRAMKAGFDGIEIHSAHGYLLNQFFSPITNRRTDEYNGQTLEGRIKFHKEIIYGTRQIIGNNAILALRIGGCDYIPGGTTIEDTVQAAKVFEKLGVDLLDISGGLCSFVRPNHPEPGYFSEISEAVKKAVRIPVLLTGGVKTIEDAEQLLFENKADMIGVGRVITKDARWGAELSRFPELLQ